ncbi:MAG: hypothetical protein JNK76_18100 [Planctomycetales bacterium]|nr:hypothetical protein [Planctomycetales bacterium]MBN8629016.1 hypothetical protein [Planctomycetota bacterium]
MLYVQPLIYLMQKRARWEIEGELAEAAFLRSAEDVARIAEQKGTPILTWNDDDELESPSVNVEDEDAPQDERR